MRSKTLLISDRSAVVNGVGNTHSFFARKIPNSVSRTTVDELMLYALDQNIDARLCLHTSPTDNQHDMVIAQLGTSYFPPHRHKSKGETWNVLHGEMVAFVFDEAGVPVDFRHLSPSGDFLYRVGANQYHMLVSISEVAVYHESKPGPFLASEDSEFAAWAPSRQDKSESAKYIGDLLSMFLV